MIKALFLYFNTKKRILKSEISILEKQDPEKFFLNFIKWMAIV